MKKQCVITAAVLCLVASSAFSMGAKPAKCDNGTGEKADCAKKVCDSKSGCEDKEYKYPVIGAQAAHQLWQGNKAVFVDALSPEMYSEKHIKGAVNIPANDLENNMKALDDAAKDDMIVVYCMNPKCGAAERTASFLAKHGYEQIYYFKGGLVEWEENGYPLN